MNLRIKKIKLLEVIRFILYILNTEKVRTKEKHKFL